jgi:hypothetical protein
MIFLHVYALKLKQVRRNLEQSKVLMEALITVCFVWKLFSDCHNKTATLQCYFFAFPEGREEA